MALFVGRLPSDMRAYELEDLFSRHGRIIRCDVKRGRSLAYGFVEFDHIRDAEDALKHSDGMIIGGSRIVVEFSKGPQRRGDERACFRCGIEGHWARDCRERNRPNSPRHSRRNYNRSRPSRRSEHSRTPSTNSSRSRSRSRGYRRKRSRYSRSYSRSASPRDKSRSKSRSYRKSSGTKSPFLRNSHSPNERSRSRARSSEKRRGRSLTPRGRDSHSPTVDQVKESVDD